MIEFVCLFALVAIVQTSSIPNRSHEDGLQTLYDDFDDIFQLIPLDKIHDLVEQHLEDDLEFQAAVQYMQSDEWKAISGKFREEPLVREAFNFLNRSGLDVEGILKEICDFVKGLNVDTDHPVRSFNKFLRDVKLAIPFGKIMEMVSEKMETSPKFREFYNEMTSDYMHQLVSKIRALTSYKRLATELTTMGVDLEKMFRIIYVVFKWEIEKYVY